MKTLVLGASGATGKHLVEQLLTRKQLVKVIIRHTANIPQHWMNDSRLQIIRADISTMSLEEAAAHISDCDALASCLGHSLSINGIYGKPRKLVTNAIQLFSEVIVKGLVIRQNPLKIVLMNTAGYWNKETDERISLSQQIAMGIIRTLLPPHRDNETAAEYLRTQIGNASPFVQWVVVRPDNLTVDPNPADYELEISPSSTLFNPHKVSRANVAHFMACLLVEPELWSTWQGRMPVILNRL